MDRKKNYIAHYNIAHCHCTCISIYMYSRHLTQKILLSLTRETIAVVPPGSLCSLKSGSK